MLIYSLKYRILNRRHAAGAADSDRRETARSPFRKGAAGKLYFFSCSGVAAITSTFSFSSGSP